MVNETRSLEEIRFLKTVSNVEILATISKQIDLSSVIVLYGHNYNTLSISNTSATADININLDGEQILFLKSGSTVFFDWEFGMTYSSLIIQNTHAADAIAAGELKISIGRSGRKTIGDTGN